MVRDWREARTSLTGAAAALTEVLDLSGREVGLHPEELKVLAVAHLFGPSSARKLAADLGTADLVPVQANLEELEHGELVRRTCNDDSTEAWAATTSGSHKLWQFQRQGVAAIVTDHYMLLLDRPSRERAKGPSRRRTTGGTRGLERSSVR